MELWFYYHKGHTDLFKKYLKEAQPIIRFTHTQTHTLLCFKHFEQNRTPHEHTHTDSRTLIFHSPTHSVCRGSGLSGVSLWVCVQVSDAKVLKTAFPAGTPYGLIRIGVHAIWSLMEVLCGMHSTYALVCLSCVHTQTQMNGRMDTCILSLTCDVCTYAGLYAAQSPS